MRRQKFKQHPIRGWISFNGHLYLMKMCGRKFKIILQTFDLVSNYHQQVEACNMNPGFFNEWFIFYGTISIGNQQ